MIKNYLTIALRNLRKNKIYLLINTFGMGIAMACCLTAYLLIAFNIEFDDYFRKDKGTKRIVKVMHHYEYANGDQDQDLTAPITMAPWAAEDIPAIEEYTRFVNRWGTLSNEDKAFEENLRFADVSFFDMFKMDLKSGSLKNFKNQQTVFLSEATAEKYFGDEDPVGKTMAVEFNDKNYELTVGGVLAKFPMNISFNIQALLRVELFLDAHEIEPDDWEYTSSVLFKLHNVNQRESVSMVLNRYATLWNETRKEDKTLSFELVPFYTPVINGEVNKSDLRLPIPYIALFIFSGLATIILLIACFNLTNTTIALTGKRMKEIGVRKVMGSGRGQIISQFILETVITISLAIVAGVVMAQIIIPHFATMWQLQYGLEDLSSMNFIMALLVLLFISAILAGVYPALFGSKFRPVELLKGRKQVKGTNLFTRTLLVFQFSLSVIVLTAGTIFTQNAAYQQELDLGYDSEKLVNVKVKRQRSFEQFKRVLTANPEIEAVAGAKNTIGPYSASNVTVRFDTTGLFKTDLYHVGAGYFDVVGLQITAGRDFIEGSETDYSSAVIVDENFVANHRLVNPIDQRLFYRDKPYRIVGVVKNHLSGLKEHNNSEHIYMLAPPSEYTTMVVKVGANTASSLLGSLRKEWKGLFADDPFIYTLQEDVVYEEANGYNKNLQQIFFFLTVLGCLLSACGIYALASLNVQKRIKEIGVRKVLGATVTSILKLVNREFAIILTLAAVLGGAGGYVLTSGLLEDLYAQHMEIGWVSVLLCCITIFIIGISATSGTIFKAAMTNPSKTLRDD
ncbi:hypothetical protein C900_00171 [Fulvivirga imtechensis AK7]|uniref:ABC transporter permease n=1 Tax=Fulvivirga imtechensis AK7 TaxID=1237149 RepID=L8JMK5_9BACT|nr:ABC transporter permease [Fulvivirga imtechensis]ELR68627.1 hypothetical protein C900_00171 [Fulvivirga imtechensis AK7]